MQKLFTGLFVAKAIILLNVQQISRIDPYEKDSHLVLLKSGAKIPVSKSGYAKLKLLLGL